MRRWLVSFLMTGLACTAVGAETPRLQPGDRRNRMFPELVVESGGRRGSCDALIFTRDGKQLLAAGDDKVVRVWNCRDGQVDPKSLKSLRWGVWGPQRGAIYALALSPDAEQRRVAIGGLGLKTTAAAVLDRLTGETVATIYPIDHYDPPEKSGFQTVRAITFSPHGERVAFGSEDGSVWLWRPEGGKKDKLKWLGKHSSGKGEFKLNRVRFLHFLDEQKLLSAAENGEVFQWDLKNAPKPGRLNVFQPEEGPIHHVLLSQDGKWLAARATKKNWIYVRSLAGKRRKDIELVENTVASSLAFNQRGQLAVSIRSRLPRVDFNMEANDEIRLYDLSAEKASFEKRLPHSWYVNTLAFHPDGDHLAVAGGDNHEVTLWNLSHPKTPPTVLRGVGNGIWNVGLSQSGRYLAFQTQRDPAATHPNQRGRGAWTVFDLRTQKWHRAPDGFTPLSKREEQDGWRVKPQGAFVWCVENPDKNIAPKRLPWNRDLYSMPRCYAFLPRAEGQPVRLAVGHYHGVSIFELTEARVRRIGLGMGHEGEVMSLAVSAKGDWLVSASDDQTICAWSLRDWPCGSELGARFARDRDDHVVVKKVDLFSPAWEAGLLEGDKVIGLAVNRQKKFLLPKAGSQGEPIGSADVCLKELAAPEPGKALEFFIQRGRDRIPMQSSVQRRPLWRFFPTRGKEWVLWMGGNPYYHTSTNGDNYIGWHMNNSDDVKKTPSFYPVEQFRNLFHKRNVIEKLLSERDIRQALDENKAGLSPPNFGKLFSSVSVRIEPLRKSDAGVELKLHIKSRTENPDFAPVRAELWINDHRHEVWPREKDEPFPKEWPKTLILKNEQLRAGDNEVVLQCYNRVQGRGESRLEDSLRVHCPREESKIKRNLYGLVVGLNDYSRSRAARGADDPLLVDLHTPYDDMKAIREAWLSQKGGNLYTEVDITLLSDKVGNADRQAILKHFQELAKKTGPDDRVFVFLAGHGLVRETEGKTNFLFCCPDYDPRKRDTSISAAKLYELLAEIPCRKVVFLDVCHSGEVVQLARVLTPSGRGPTILAACDSGESSWEPLQLSRAETPNGKPGSAKPGADGKSSEETKERAGKNSFFVAALLEAFQGADRNDNGLLDAREIYEYTLNRVPEMLKDARVNSRQTPTNFPDVDFLQREVLLARRTPARK